MRANVVVRRRANVVVSRGSAVIVAKTNNSSFHTAEDTQKQTPALKLVLARSLTTSFNKPRHKLQTTRSGSQLLATCVVAVQLPQSRATLLLDS